MNASRRSSAIVQQPAAQLYNRFVAGIKQRIRTAQIKTALAANAELILHYWEVGRDILISQERQGWGAKVIDRLAVDLQREFPKLAGYSARNLKYTRAFAEAWPDRAIVQQLAAQIPWSHNCVLLDRLKDPEAREFYIRKTVEHGWSRSVLVHQLDTKLHKRLGKASTNFALTLPPVLSDLAREMLKDPYVFKPALLNESASERILENALLARLRDFLIELGAGFAFVGNQYRVEVNGEEFFLDLLFYHTRLHCYIVVDLKVVDFQPEFVGKMNFYQTAVDNIVKSKEDGPTIGMILCRGKNKTVVEYTLRDAKSPVGVAEYRLLPTALKAQLPDASKLKRVVSDSETSNKNSWP
ncbi:MAG TPA: PDDEXK nuclease domain-containing protein [Verrucomicrobiae bacterium]|jgi:predicted nuclease of restriction endonuclease-like (RecB) superfamily